MKSAIFLLLISSSLLLSRLSEAAGYVDKSGNPAPNPCKNGENVYFDTLIFNCIDSKKVYYGCKVGNAEVQQDTVKDENNLRTLYCHKEGSSVKTVVTGCVTDDNIFINETKTVKQNDGTEFSCNKQSNGFSYVKKSPPTKVSDCTQGEKKVVASRYLLECYEESAGYFTFKLAACYSTPDDEKTRIEVSKTHDDYVSDDKQLGFRYTCHAQGNSFYYEPIGCLLGGQFIAPGNLFQNNSLTVMCMRDGPQRLRLRPVYNSGTVDEKACTETKTYTESNFKYECQPGQQPKPVACVFFKNQKEIPIGGIYNDDKAYQYKCEQTSDAKHIALVKVACLDDQNELLVEGGKKTLSDGSRIECQRNPDDGLLRVIVAGKPPVEQCKEGEKFVKDYLQYQCQSGKIVPFACAPLNNETLVIEIGKTYDAEHYQYKCENQGKAVTYHPVACLDVDRKLIMPGEKRQVKIFTYECLKRANNELALVISNEKGCKHPALQGKLVRPNDVIEISRIVNKLEYKSLFQCAVGGDKGYYLIDVGCKVDGKKYNIGYYVNHQSDVYKCVRPIAGGVHLIHIPINQLGCFYGNKVYRTGDQFKSADGISHYECMYGKIVKTACFVHDKRIPVNQLMYCNDEPYYCPGKGEGVIPIPVRGCYRKNGQLIKLGDSFNEKDIAYACTYTQYENIFKPVIVPIGCVYKGKIIPINSYILHESKHIVCEVDNSFTVIAHPANPQQEQCIEKTATYNCESSNGNGDGEGGPVTKSPNGDHTATADHGNGNNGNSNTGSTKPGSGNNNENGFPTDSDGNLITTLRPRDDFTATAGTGENNGNGQITRSTSSGNGNGNENGFPPDDDNGKATTPHGASGDDDDCDDSTTPSGPHYPGDYTATRGPGGHHTRPGGRRTTSRDGNIGNENPFPTDEQGNPVTPRDYTATRGPHGHHTNRPGGRTTERHGNTDNENPFPTDEQGNPVTSRDYTATRGPGGHHTRPNGRTTKRHGNTGNENPFPTDEQGNPVTPRDYTATRGPSGHHTRPNGKTTKRHGNTDNDNPIPTDEQGNPVTPQGYTATGQSNGHNPNDPQHGTTKVSNGNNNENPFPTDEQGNPITKIPDYTATGYSGNPGGPGGRTTDSNGNYVTPPGDVSATGFSNPHGNGHPTRNPNYPNEPEGPGHHTKDPNGHNHPTRNPNDPNEPELPGHHTKDPNGPSHPTRNPSEPEGPGHHTKDPNGPGHHTRDTNRPHGPGHHTKDPNGPNHPTRNPNDPSEPEGPGHHTKDPNGPSHPTRNPSDPREPDGPGHHTRDTNRPHGPGHHTKDPNGPNHPTRNPNDPSEPEGPGHHTRDTNRPHGPGHHTKDPNGPNHPTRNPNDPSEPEGPGHHTRDTNRPHGPGHHTKDPNGPNHPTRNPNDPNEPEGPGHHTKDPNGHNHPTRNPNDPNEPEGPGHHTKDPNGPSHPTRNPNDPSEPEGPGHHTKDPNGPGHHTRDTNRPHGPGHHTKDPNGPNHPTRNPNDPSEPEGPGHHTKDPNGPSHPTRNPSDPREPDGPGHHTRDTNRPHGPGHHTKDPNGPNHPTRNPNDPSEPEGPGHHTRDTNRPHGPGHHTKDPNGPNHPTRNPNDPSEPEGPGHHTKDPNGPGHHTRDTNRPHGPGHHTKGPNGPGHPTRNPTDPTEPELPGHHTKDPNGPGHHTRDTNRPHGPGHHTKDPNGPNHPTRNPNNPNDPNGNGQGSTRNPNEPNGPGGNNNTPENPNGPGQKTTRDPNNPTSPHDPNHGTSGNPNGPGNNGGSTPDTSGNTDGPGGGTKRPPFGHGSTVPPNQLQKCKDLLPKNICRQLQPLCVPHSLRKAATTVSTKSYRDHLISLIENSTANENYYVALASLVQQNVYPDEVLKTQLPSISVKKQIPLITKTLKANCIAHQEQCQSNTDPLACTKYVAHCSSDLNAAVCKATTTCTTTKDFYKTITGEIISKLCPESCLVQECYTNHIKPGKLDLHSLIAPELLTCLLA